MGRNRLIVVMCFLLGALVLPWGDGLVHAQADQNTETSDAASAGRLRERAAKSQERRKARVTQAQRQAAAERAKQKQAAPVGKAAPDGSGKGGVK